MSESQTKLKYDLEERTAVYGENVIRFCQKVKLNEITRPLINQFIRSATSIGANYLEANGASSRKDFKNKIFICKKEAQECRHWCRMLEVVLVEDLENLKYLKQESKELCMIFQAIVSKIE